MSDFDREAERERLREQYEQDRQEREATERMSELLLQGATMTNAHCSDCGDPIFRYDGQEFCATCEKAVDRDTDGEGTDGSDEANGDTEGDDTPEESTGGERIEVTSPDEETRVQFGDGQSPESEGAEAPETPDATAESEPEPETPSAPAERREQVPSAEPTAASDPSRRGQAPETTRRRRDPPVRTPETGPTSSTAGGDIATARGSLERTLAELSQQAEAAEDPAQAREYLAAAREAAEALAALRR